MIRRRMGAKGPEVSAIGLGCMGMSFAYGAGDDAESTRTLPPGPGRPATRR